MNPITAFLVRNIIVIFFFYGLAFFVMGLALVFASRQTSEFKFSQAIRPLAAFGLLHGLHEWFEMFQQIAAATNGHVPTLAEEIVRLALLIISFLMLLAFGMSLLRPAASGVWPRYRPLLWFIGLWASSLWVVFIILKPPAEALIAQADVLSRYSLGIPGALLGTWALMAQQRTFREHNMPQFGRDLVWCAAALFLYGVIGQLFVRQTSLVPSMVINGALFLQWFGIPVQLFRGLMAALIAFYMVRALRAFELENRQQIEAAHRARLQAQAAALAAERRAGQEMERLNRELRLTAHERSFLLDLSNLLAAPLTLQHRLNNVLAKIVDGLNFPEAGMILLLSRETQSLQVQVTVGFSTPDECVETQSCYEWAIDLSRECVARGIALCRHLDGQVIEFTLEDALKQQECQRYKSPTLMISLPLTVQEQVIGSLVLAQPEATGKILLFDEFKLMVGIGQQLGLSIENARLYREAQKREKLLGELLHQVVGAQEAERQRIARELHDATGQSLTAIALGLRGIEARLTHGSPQLMTEIREVTSFSTQALDELRQIIADLRPSQLDDLGLVAALQWYTQVFARRYEIQTDFVITGKPGRLPSEYETVLFRITQEALTNIAKHARASQVMVRLETTPAQIEVAIEDNGRGFDPETVLRAEGQPTGWGLLGIRERALLLGGQYEIDSKRGQGTCIRVRVPVVREQENGKNTLIAG